MLKKFQLYPNLSYEQFIKFILISRPNRQQEGYEQHHIIPKCLGGTNNLDNLIWLTVSEHIEAHRKLYLENKDNPSLFCAYNAAINFNRKHCDIEEVKLLSELKRQFMTLNNPMHNAKHRATLSKSKLGERNSACKPDQRIALYDETGKIDKVFYSAREAGIYVSKELDVTRSWQSATTSIRYNCKNLTSEAVGRHWGFITDKQYREILLEVFNHEVM